MGCSSDKIDIRDVRRMFIYHPGYFADIPCKIALLSQHWNMFYASIFVRRVQLCHYNTCLQLNIQHFSSVVHFSMFQLFTHYRSIFYWQKIHREYRNSSVIVIGHLIIKVEQNVISISAKGYRRTKITFR